MNTPTNQPPQWAIQAARKSLLAQRRQQLPVEYADVVAVAHIIAEAYAKHAPQPTNFTSEPTKTDNMVTRSGDWHKGLEALPSLNLPVPPSSPQGNSGVAVSVGDSSGEDETPIIKGETFSDSSLGNAKRKEFELGETPRTDAVANIGEHAVWTPLARQLECELAEKDMEREADNMAAQEHMEKLRAQRNDMEEEIATLRVENDKLRGLLKNTCREEDIVCVPLMRLEEENITLRAQLATALEERQSYAEKCADWEKKWRNDLSEEHCIIATVTKERDDRERASKVMDAAILWAYCPSEGGYREGAAVEDTCEGLSEAVRDFVKLDNRETPYWTEEEMRAAIDATIDAARTQEEQT